MNTTVKTINVTLTDIATGEQTTREYSNGMLLWDAVRDALAHVVAEPWVASNWSNSEDGTVATGDVLSADYSDRIMFTFAVNVITTKQFVTTSGTLAAVAARDAYALADIDVDNLGNHRFGFAEGEQAIDVVSSFAFLSGITVNEFTRTYSCEDSRTLTSDTMETTAASMLVHLIDYRASWSDRLSVAHVIGNAANTISHAYPIVVRLETGEPGEESSTTYLVSL